VSRGAQQQTADPQVLIEIVGIGNIHYLSGSFTTWKTVTEVAVLS